MVLLSAILLGGVGVLSSLQRLLSDGGLVGIIVIVFFLLLPWHDPGELHPTVLWVQRPAEQQKEILQRKLVIIRAVVPPNTQNPGLFM